MNLVVLILAILTNLSVVNNGIQLKCTTTTSATHSDLDFNEWMHIAAWRQNGTWYVSVNQNDISVVSNPLVNGDEVFGIHDLYVYASDDSVQWYLRDLMVSDGQEYDHGSLSINADLIWNHTLDNYVGSPPMFGDAVPQYQWPFNTTYTFNGNQDGSSDFNPANTTVVGCKIPISAPGLTHTFIMDIKNGPPTLSNEYIFSVGARCYSLNTYSGQFSFYALTGVNWNATYDVWTNLRFVFEPSGCTLYVNGSLQAFIGIGDINTNHLSNGVWVGIYATGHNSSVYTGYMRNFEFYQNVALHPAPGSPPTWETAENTIYTFNGNQTAGVFDVNSTTVVGTKLDDPAFDVGTGAWTFAYWVKVTGGSSHYSLLNRDLSYGFSAFFEHMIIHGGFYWRLGAAPNNDDPIWNYSFSTNQWYHIVLAYDGNGEGYGYVDKSLQTLAVDNNPAIDFTSDTDFYIGSRPDGANKFVGQMKNMKWWNRMLTAAEVNQVT